MSTSIPPAIHVVAASHGTDNPDGQRLINQLRGQLEGLSANWRPELRWHEAYVDVQQPSLPQVLASLPAGEPAVVLPLLVADGVHTTHDVAQAVASRDRTIAADPLGPLPDLAKVLAQRARPHLENDPMVILAAAGTRLEVGQQQIVQLAAKLQDLLGREVAVAYCAGAQPNVLHAVADAGSRPVLLLSVLLADGFFQDKLASTGAAVVTSPLLPDVTIAQCFLVRLKTALETAGFMTPHDEVRSL
ncbi:sirohydrochlorin chelatase [Glutamicibacter protophormiae]|uniref:sirohydrochlorin chelatase n=1 Tax=Glutamicibacter protophormiae TaxID=37930 RepID=UPI00195F20C9|nr:CbiX/SirB N-terminal domain-containing protein [Glutamicibacter protophormiae]QRQ77222.1 sirohydrochlorin chelatase [Glutamicibacter protophormiae]